MATAHSSVGRSDSCSPLSGNEPFTPIDALPFTHLQPDARGLLTQARSGRPDTTAGFYRRKQRRFETEPMGDLVGRAYAVGDQLARQGLDPGDVAVISIAAHDAALITFLGAISIGAVPVIVPIRPAFDDPTSVHRRLDDVFAELPAEPALISLTDNPVDGTTVAHRAMHVTIDATPADSPARTLTPAAPDDVAYLQMSSGSTRRPRPIAVTHGALVAQMASVAERARFGADDVFNAWVPLYHDLCLVGYTLLPMGLDVSFNLMMPFDFLGDPTAWIRGLADTGATTTVSPNFGLRFACDRVRHGRLEGTDLSSIRRVYCGAEPVDADTLRRFHRTFAPYGLDLDALIPTYGMAETTLMVTMPHLGASVHTTAIPRADLVDLGPLTHVERGTVASPPPAADDTVEVTGLGPAGPGTEITLESVDGESIETDLTCGEVVVRSTSLTAGYLCPDGSIESFDRGGFHTGDIGFLDGDELYLVDRLKNTIIRNGQNISSSTIEHLVAEVVGYPADAVVVIDSDITEGHGRLTAVIEADRKAEPDTLIGAVAAAADRFRPALDDVIVLRPNGLPRTTSGKKQHRLTRQLLQRDELRVATRRSLTPDEATSPSDDGPSRTDEVIDLTEIETRSAAMAAIAEFVDQRNPGVTVTAESRFTSDLGLDSLAMYELAIVLEDALAIEMSESDLRDATVVGQLCDACVARRRQPAHDRPTGIGSALASAAQPFPQLLRTVDAQKDRQVEIGGQWITDFASCNYLGLDLHPDVIAAVEPALRQWGTHPSWTRAVASPAPYRQLEVELADLIGVPGTIVFPTLTLLHMGVMPQLAGAGDAVFIDRAAHRSLQEAAELTRGRGARVEVIDHDDTDGLDAAMARVPAQRRLIVVDGVYSMSGGPAPLADLIEVAERHDALVYVDDAHGFGVLGERPDPRAPYGHRGNGVVRHLGLDYERVIYTAGLSKAYSSMGAFISVTDEHQRRRFEEASTYVFSGPVPVASLATALAGLRVNAADGDRIRRRLWTLTQRLIDGLAAMGFTVDDGYGLPIVNITLGAVEVARDAADTLWAHNVLFTPSLWPAVPLENSGVRFTVTSANTDGEIDQVLAAMAVVADRHRIGAAT